MRARRKTRSKAIAAENAAGAIVITFIVVAFALLILHSFELSKSVASSGLQDIWQKEAPSINITMT